MKHLLKLLVLLSAALLSGCPGPAGEWVDGYQLTFLRQGTSVMVLRYFEGGQWQETTGVSSESGSGLFKGVAMASELGGLRSVLGFTKGDQLFLHEGLGLEFGEFPQTPDHEMGGVTSAPAIVHIRGSEFLIAFSAPDETVHLHPFNFGQGLGGQIALTVDGNDHVLGHPTLAYHNGRLVVVWTQWTSPPRFRYAAADYQPGDTSINVVANGEVPTGGPEEVPEVDPTLVHDGSGTFYLAVLYKSSLTGLTHDSLSVYSSPDGMAWAVFNGGVPDDHIFPTGRNSIAIAAQPSGEILLAVSTDGPGTGSRVGKVFRFLNGSGWTEIDSNAVFKWEPSIDSFSLIRSQYVRNVSNN